MTAQSQQARQNTGEANQNKSSVQDQPARDDKRGTKDAPLIVEMTNPPNGDAIAGEIKKNRETQAEESRNAFIFNCLLVAVGFLQGGALIYTALVTNKAANAAKAAAEAVPLIERAYVFVKMSARDVSYYNEFGKDWGEVRVKVVFANRGKTPAMLTGDVTLDPVQVRNPAMEMIEVQQGGTILYVVGVLEYTDVLGARRETGFCWQYDPARDSRFRPSNGHLNYYR